MIWALLALLGIPIWFIIVILVAVFRNRKAVRSRPDVFQFIEADEEGWKRGIGYARWVSDVVIVHMGPGLIRTDARQVVHVETSGDIADPPKKLDDGALEMTWTFADSAPRRIAVAPSEVDLASGQRKPESPD